jgi:hypothetical protein
LLAQVNEIVAQISTKKKVLDGILEGYLAINPRYINSYIYMYLYIGCNRTSGSMCGVCVYDDKIKYAINCTHRLEPDTMFKVRAWERFQFRIEDEHKQVRKREGGREREREREQAIARERERERERESRAGRKERLRLRAKSGEG